MVFSTNRAVSIVLTSLMVFVAYSAYGQGEGGSVGTRAGTEIPGIPARVIGLSSGDLLNIRATASSMGTVLGRLANGGAVTRYECTLAGSHEWCLIQADENPDLVGWSPARYLIVQHPQEGLALSGAASQEERAREGGSVTIDENLPFPSGFEERFAGHQQSLEADSDASVTSSPGGTESESVALPTMVPVPTSRPATEPSELGVDESREEMTTIVTARHQIAGTPTAAAVSNRDEIPCARYLGQPMAVCKMKISAKGNLSVDVTVLWPDGGERIIEFREGKPARSNSRDQLRASREGTLNLIRIGNTERFEILDSMVLELKSVDSTGPTR